MKSLLPIAGFLVENAQIEHGFQVSRIQGDGLQKVLLGGLRIAVSYRYQSEVVIGGAGLVGLGQDRLKGSCRIIDTPKLEISVPQPAEVLQVCRIHPGGLRHHPGKLPRAMSDTARAGGRPSRGEDVDLQVSQWRPPGRLAVRSKPDGQGT
jgi:hypothetical protein